MRAARPSFAGRFARLVPVAKVLLPLVAFGVALWFLHEELARTRLSSVWAAIRATTPSRVAVAGGLTGLSFLLLTLYDVLGLRYAGVKLPYRKTSFASGVAFGVSHAVGFTILTGIPIRYRLYTSWGLSALQVSKVVAFYSITFWIGVMTLFGGLLLMAPATLAEPLSLSPNLVRAGALLVLAPVGVYLLRTLLGKPSIGIRTLQVEVPTRRLALLQPLLGPLDWMVAASVLYVLLPPEASVPFPHFLAAFLAAHILGTLSHVPAGLGVVEATLVTLLGDEVGTPALLAAMGAYRAIYYLVPLVIASTALGAHEWRRRRAELDRLAARLSRLALPIAPTALAAATFAAGAILLLTGSLPGEPERLTWLGRVLPLSVIELSHMGASILGSGLLILSRGLQRRLDSAYVISVVVLAIAIVLAFGRGVDYWEAASLAAVLLALIGARKRFDRKSALAGEALGTGWMIAVGCVLLTAVWVGFLAYRHVPYQADQWWAFALRGDASRFLRASFAGSVVLGLFGLSRLLGPARPRFTRPDVADLDRAAVLAAASDRSAAALALLGDKQLIFSESGQSMLMYGIEGRAWVALGDPIGPIEEWDEILWTFVQRARLHDDHPVFYQVGGKHLALYAELGLGLLKLGEVARVPLTEFSLEGSARKGMRRALRTLERDGCSFEVVPQPLVLPIMEELRGVSDRWLSEKKITTEKGFSLGYFELTYIARFPVATVRLDGKLVAFANLWLGAPGTEISPDLMRYVPDAPNGVMDYLFAQIMLWGQQAGYTWFNLGAAPLSGLASHALAPTWERIGSLVFRFGDQFYGFEGLRDFKEKFDPVWEPTYLAAPGGLALPRVLTNVTTLISGGVGRLFSR